MEPCGTYLGSLLVWHSSKSRFLKKETEHSLGRRGKCDLGGPRPFVLAGQLEAALSQLPPSQKALRGWQR